MNTIRTLLRHKWVGVAWLFNAAFSVALVAASAEAVLRWAGDLVEAVLLGSVSGAAAVAASAR